MNKTLGTTLVLAMLISAAAANAPGLLLALGNSQEADPAEGQAGSSVAPVDYYAYDYDYDTTQADPGEWLDALFQAGNEASVASWHHTWTDFETAPTLDALNPHRRPVHWEPEGVLFAYLATFSDIGYTDLRENFADPGSGKWTGTRFAALGGGGGGGSRGPGDEPGPDEPGPEPDDVPHADPPPPDDETPVPPGPDTDPPPPVSVPEPAPMGLFALGLAGLFMFGRRRRLVALARAGRDRT